MTHVTLQWHDVHLTVTRRLPVAIECPKCLTGERDVVAYGCDALEYGYQQRLFRRDDRYDVSRCKLCKTLYARPANAVTCAQVEQACDAALVELTHAERSAKVRAFFGLDKGELARGLDLRGELDIKALSEAWEPARRERRATRLARRTLRERVSGALRGLVAGWRGAT